MIASLLEEVGKGGEDAPRLSVTLGGCQAKPIAGKLAVFGATFAVEEQEGQIAL